MRKSLKVCILSACVAVLAAGCTMTQVRERGISWSKSHIKNMETAREIAGNLNEAWPEISGAIRKWYEIHGGFDRQVPPAMKDAIEDLDEIVICGQLQEFPVTCKDGKEVSEELKKRYSAGASLALHATMVGGTVEQMIAEILDALERVAPGLLKNILAFL